MHILEWNSYHIRTSSNRVSRNPCFSDKDPTSSAQSLSIGVTGGAMKRYLVTSCIQMYHRWNHRKVRWRIAKRILGGIGGFIRFFACSFLCNMCLFSLLSAFHIKKWKEKKSKHRLAGNNVVLKLQFAHRRILEILLTIERTIIYHSIYTLRETCVNNTRQACNAKPSYEPD